ncbi:MAG: hypothetical protein QMA94_03775 [Aquiluna sp.]
MTSRYHLGRIEDSRDSVLNADCDGMAIASGARQRIITQSL